MAKKINKILKYYHMHYDETLFGDQKYVTEEMLRHYAENDEYELQQIKNLWDSTDPEVRNWQNPIPKDRESYGVNAGTYDGKEIYQFSDDRQFHGSCAFKNFNTIDKNKTTAHIDTEQGKALIPVNVEEVKNSDTCNNGPWGEMKANEYWYSSYNRTKTYTPAKYIKETNTTTTSTSTSSSSTSTEETTTTSTNTQDLDNDGVLDYLNSTEIPAICRAQKFIAKETGYLKTLTLNLKGDKDAEYPLIVEIYEWTEGKDLPVIDKSKKLATSTYKFTVTSSAMTAINFDSPAYVKKNSEYFFVIRSPLTTYNHTYGIGGWSASCYSKDADKFTDGEAFLSENNGYSWIKHGKKDTKLKYHNGQQPPVSFAFTAYIEETRNTYPTDTDGYTIIFKTLRMNPVVRVDMHTTEEKPTNTSIDWEISQNGRDWKGFNNHSIDFGNNTSESEERLYDNPNSTYLFLKATLRTTDASVTPSISWVELNCVTLPAHTAYFKSSIFTPRTEPMLGASVWSKCYHPYKTTDPSVEVLIDIFRSQTSRDRFKIINTKDITDYKFTEEFLKEYYNIDKSFYLKIDDEDTSYNFTQKELTDEEAEAIANVRTAVTGTETSGEKIKSIFTLNSHLDLTDTEIKELCDLLNTRLKNVESTSDSLTTTAAETFIQEYPLIVNQLRKYNIFLYGTTNIPLSKPAVKYLTSVSFKPEEVEGDTSTETSVPLAEDHDFEADYDMGLNYNGEGDIKFYELKFTNLDSSTNSLIPNLTYALEDYGTTVLSFSSPTDDDAEFYKLGVGDLEVEYQPLYLKGLTMEAFYKYDANGDELVNAAGENICDGFPLDLMIDEFTAWNNDEEEFDLEFELTVDPVCAIRSVLVNENTDYERELYEDSDFTVDYENRRLRLLYNPFDNPTDTLTVRYTPNLTDTGLGVAYRMTRNDNMQQAYILPNYWQYRV